MSSPYESADLLLKLYDLRREPTMRQARAWFVGFNPDSIDDVMKAMSGEHNAYFRMVTSFWDMAAALVNNGAIDEKMFNDANGEQHVVFCKIEPFIAEYRAKMGNPAYLASIEKLVMQTPGAKERMATLRDRFRAMAAAPAR